MEVSVILAHPQQGSFNHAIADTVVETLKHLGHSVHFHDLYAEHFDPIIPPKEILRDAELDATISRYCRELAASEGIVIVHPNWWGQPPAILKGWMDRVLRPGVAYEFLAGDGGEGIPCGLLKASAAIVFNTANTPTEREQKIFGDPLESIWQHCIFELCGVPAFYRRMFRVIVTSTAEQRRAWLHEVETTVKRYFPQ